MSKQFNNKKYYLLIDQALVSLLNFGSIFLLSKFASVTLFGEFVIVYSYSNLAFVLGTYFLSSPVLVFLPKKKRDENTTYLALVLLYSVVVILTLSMIFYFIMSFQVSRVSFWPFFIMTLFMVCFDVLKKFVFGRANIKLLNTLLPSFVLVLLFFLGILAFTEQLSIDLILMIYGLSFLVPSALLLAYFKTEKFFNVSKVTISRRNIFHYLKEHFTFSKWIIGGGFLFWSYSQGIYILSEFIGVNEFGLGKVRTIQNLLGLFSILIISMENHFLPQFARNVYNLSKQISMFYAKYSFYILLIFLISAPVIYFSYDLFYEEKYGNGVLIISIIWLTQLLIVFLRPYAISLKAKEITYPLFFSHLSAFVCMLSFGAYLIYIFQELGIALTIFMVYLVVNLTILKFYKNLKQES